MQVSFYQVKGETPGAVDAVLPALLGKAMGVGPVLLVAPTENRAQRLEESLWEPGAGFLPHGLAGGAHDGLQPVLLVAAAGDVASGGRLPVVIAGAEGALEGLLAEAPERLLYVFESASTSVERARGVWKGLKGREGVELKYWAQEGGRWASKA
jgi:DNA polymerase-3 subunit chi